jgi:hypothetical protein
MSRELELVLGRKARRVPRSNPRLTIKPYLSRLNSLRTAAIDHYRGDRPAADCVTKTCVPSAAFLPASLVQLEHSRAFLALTRDLLGKIFSLSTDRLCSARSLLSESSLHLFLAFGTRLTEPRDSQRGPTEPESNPCHPSSLVLSPGGPALSTTSRVVPAIRHI